MDVRGTVDAKEEPWVCPTNSIVSGLAVGKLEWSCFSLFGAKLWGETQFSTV